MLHLPATVEGIWRIESAGSGAPSGCGRNDVQVQMRDAVWRLLRLAGALVPVVVLIDVGAKRW